MADTVEVTVATVDNINVTIGLVGPQGTVAVASQAEVDAGTNNTKAVTPLTLVMTLGDLHYVDPALRPGNDPLNDKLVAAIAEEMAATKKGAIYLNPSDDWVITELVDFRQLSLLAPGGISIDRTANADAGLVFGEFSAGGSRTVDIRSISATHVPGVPDVTFGGDKASRVNIQRANEVHVRVDGNTVTNNSLAYCKFDFGFLTTLDLDGVNGGWINENEFTGRYTQLIVDSSDLSYTHNNNRFDAVFEGSGQVMTVNSANGNHFSGRFEGVPLIDFGVETMHNDVTCTWTQGLTYEMGLPPKGTFTDLGLNNRYERKAWKEATSLFNMEASMPAGAAWRYFLDMPALASNAGVRTVHCPANSIVRIATNGDTRLKVQSFTTDGLTNTTEDNIDGNAAFWTYDSGTGTRGNSVTFPAQNYALILKEECLFKIEGRISNAITVATATISVDVRTRGIGGQEVDTSVSLFDDLATAMAAVVSGYRIGNKALIATDPTPTNNGYYVAGLAAGGGAVGDAADTWISAGPSGSHGVAVEATTGSTETLGTEPSHKMTMDQDCTFTFPTPVGVGHTFMLNLRGAFTPTFPGSVDWDSGAPPAYVGTGNGSLYVFTTLDSGTTWLGVLAGSAFN